MANVTTKIENMKKQTFGVEIEMNSISRKDAAKLAAEFFGTGRYEDTAWDDGYCTWSAWDQEGRKWKFSRDSSIDGPDFQKCEMVTPILTYKDMELLQELVRRLRKAGAKSDASRGCGVHIHIGADGHTAKTLTNLVHIMASHEQLIADALRIDKGRISSYCKMVDPAFLARLEAKKPMCMTELAMVWYDCSPSAVRRHTAEHYDYSRYHMLNLHATFTKGTIEFRAFNFATPTAERKGGLHAGLLKTWIQLCLALSQMAKDAKKASPKPQQTENPKYAMRTWLLRLGFIGEEFATARDFLTRNLAGDTAFRHGRAA